MGTSFAQSNSQKNLTMQSDLNYQATTRVFSLTSSTQFTSQQKTNNTNETTVKTEYFKQLRESNWYSGGIANFLSSSEQQIDLRTTLGAALAVRPIYTNKTNLSFIERSPTPLKKTHRIQLHEPAQTALTLPPRYSTRHFALIQRALTRQCGFIRVSLQLGVSE